MSTHSKKEQARKKKESAWALKRAVLLRELKSSQLTVERHDKKWKQLLVDIAVPQMREEMELAWTNFERAMDNKDYTISLLMEELRENEEQYTTSAKGQFEHVDELINMFKERIDEMKEDYNNRIKELEQMTEDEVGGITQTINEDENYLKTILYILDLNKKQQRSDVRAEFFYRLEEEEIKNSRLLQRLRLVLELAHSVIEKETDDLLGAYNEHVKLRQKEYDLLKLQDDALKKLLQLQLDKIKKAYDTIKRLKTEYAECRQNMGRKVKDMEIEFQFFNNAFNILKKRLEEDQQVDAKKFEVLTICHNETVEHLEKIKTKGEHLLHVAAVCRKLETQEEKILPFPCTDIKDEEVIIDMHETAEYLKSLDTFWQKVGQAEASRYAILEERDYLRRENEILRKQIHEYCQCLKCPVPQSEINRKLFLPLNVNKTSMYVTELTDELRKYEKQGVLVSKF